MTLQTLTYEQRLLLQRFFDKELDAGSSAHDEATALIDELVHAQQWVDSLEELALAVRGAEKEIWELAPSRASEHVVDVAMHASTQEMTLPSLAPMLERMHDEEITDEERDFLESLLTEQEEAASYMGTLEAMRYSVQSSHEQALEQVDFSGFFDAIESRLDEDLDAPVVVQEQDENVIQFPGKSSTRERAPFDMEEHQLLLARFFDGEASEEERAQVSAWAEIDEKVAETLDVFGELSLATRASIDELTESVEFSTLWSGVEETLHDDFAKGPNVISLEVARANKELEAPKPVPNRARREFFIAVAAAVLTVFGVGLFSDKLFPSETRVVETVVIVDSVEYQGGSSGMVMQPASMLTKEVQPDKATSPKKDDETPTIIWILDEDKPEQTKTPAQKDKKAPKVNDQPI